MRIEYLAGLFDGEGCIVLYGKPKRTKALGLNVCIGMCDRRTIMRVRRSFGGARIRVRMERSGRIFYRLNWWDRNAEKILKRLEPYLITKRQQARLAIRFMRIKSRKNRLICNPVEGKGGAVIKPHLVLLERSIKAKIHAANKGRLIA